MNITTINDKMFMTYNYYITRPISAVEMKLNKILAENPNLIKSFNRSHIHPLFQKFSYNR